MMYVIGAITDEAEDSKDVLDRVESYRKENDVFLQIFNPSKVVGKEHLQWAHQKAEECFKNDTNRADDREIETLLWASAEWQIKDALGMIGIEEEVEKVAVMIDEEPESFIEYMGWTRDDSILEPSIEKLRSLDISEDELNTVDSPYDLIFEKMATSIL